MLYSIVVVLLVFWGLGVVTSVTAGGLIHALPVIALILFVLEVTSGRRTV